MATRYFTSGEDKLISFEEDPMTNANAVAKQYDLDKGWIPERVRYAGKVSGGSDWDEIPKSAVSRQIQRMEAKRIRRGG